MELNRKERLLLWNQYSILEILQPEDADHFKKLKTIVENGYRLHYGDLWPHIDEAGFPEEAAREVISILGMFEAIQDSRRNLGPIEGVEDWMLEFAGFDGNNECEQLGYLRFLVEQQERFQHVMRRQDFNSHAPLLGLYREMLTRYRESGSSNQLTADQIRNLVSVRQRRAG